MKIAMAINLIFPAQIQIRYVGGLWESSIRTAPYFGLQTAVARLQQSKRHSLYLRLCASYGTGLPQTFRKLSPFTDHLNLLKKALLGYTNNFSAVLIKDPILLCHNLRSNFLG